MASGINPNLMGTLNLNKNDTNKEAHNNRNLTVKEIYSIFGPLMVTHKLIELDDDFKKYLMLDGINVGPEEKKLICRDISDKIQSEIKEYEYVFIKLNSKAPTDSEFLCLQLKCYTLDDILTFFGFPISFSLLAINLSPFSLYKSCIFLSKEELLYFTYFFGS